VPLLSVPLVADILGILKGSAFNNAYVFLQASITGDRVRAWWWKTTLKLI